MVPPIPKEPANNMNNKGNDLESNDTLNTATNQRGPIQRTSIVKKTLLLFMFVFALFYLQKLSVVGVEKGFTHLDTKFNISCGILLPKCSTECFEFYYNSTTLDTDYIRRTRTWWDNACAEQLDDTQIIVFVGSIFGSISIPVFADKFGRNLAFQISCAVEIIFAFCAIAFQSYWWGLAIFRFITAFAVYGMKPIGIAYLMEITAVKFRLFVLALYLFPFNLDDLIITGFDSYGPKQQYLVLPMIVPPIMYLFASIYHVPESPQWKTAVRRSRNPGPTVPTISGRAQNSEPVLVEVEKNVNDAVKQPAAIYTMSKVNFWNVCNFPHLIKKIWQLYLVCIVGLFSFFVIPHYIHYGGDSKFLDNLIVASCQLIGHGCIYFVRDVDRKTTLKWENVLASIFIFFIMFFKDSRSLWITFFSCIAFICTSMSNLILHLYAVEFLPTVIRCTGIGIMQTISVIISTGSPHVIKLASTCYLIPPAILFAVLVIGCVFIRFMPETKGKRFLVTLEDGDLFCGPSTNTTTGPIQ